MVSRAAPPSLARAGSSTRRAPIAPARARGSPATIRPSRPRAPAGGDDRPTARHRLGTRVPEGLEPRWHGTHAGLAIDPRQVLPRQRTVRREGVRLEAPLPGPVGAGGEAGAC